MNHRYFVSIRERDMSGATVWASHIDAPALADAKAKAEAEFFADPVCPSSDPSIIKFYADMKATRDRCREIGFVILGRRSTAKA